MISLGVFYWACWFIGIFFGPLSYYPAAPLTPGLATWRPFGGSLLLWVMLFIIGWQVFGQPIGKH